jgi:hypothetical protein
LLPVPSAEQQPAPAQLPPFRVGVDALQLDVSVLDRNRRPVRGLTAADFTVLEDGKPSRIVAFSAVESAGSAGATGSAPAAPIDTVPADVIDNELTDVGRTAPVRVWRAAVVRLTRLPAAVRIKMPRWPRRSSTGSRPERRAVTPEVF